MIVRSGRPFSAMVVTAVCRRSRKRTVKLEFPVYTDLPILTMREYKLGGTPQTIVVSPQGQVNRIWSGAFAEDLKREVEDYFGVKLPGIMDPKSSKPG